MASPDPRPQPPTERYIMQPENNTVRVVDDPTRIAYIALATFAPTAWQFSTVTSEGPAAKLAEFPPRIAQHRRERATTLLTRAKQLGIRTIVPGDEEWPRQIEDLNRDGGAIGAPLCFWVRGNHGLADTFRRSVMVTGAAGATEYGKRLARSIGYDLADGRHGWTVCNAGRFGIDAEAIKGASLAIDRAPRNVMSPHGLDRPYPSSRSGVCDAVTAEGLFVSAFPPGFEADRIARSRNLQYLAALTSATVVVESLIRSGCLTAARRAKAMGRPVMAIPGAVTAPESAGCHQLISEGTARLVTCGPDITNALPPLT